MREPPAWLGVDLNFPRVLCERWSARATWCCSGDAAATAHFSIGSGNEARAWRAPIALAQYGAFRAREPRRGVPANYEAARRSGSAASLQSAARNSVAWFEDRRALRESGADPVQLLVADPFPAHQPRESPSPRPGKWLEGAEAVVPCDRAGVAAEGSAPACDRCSTPFRAAGASTLEEPGRRLSHGAVPGRGRAAPRTGTWCTMPSGPRAAQGSICTEMTCVSRRKDASAPGCHGPVRPTSSGGDCGGG